jgi:hypothetical protein
VSTGKTKPIKGIFILFEIFIISSLLLGDTFVLPQHHKSLPAKIML